MIYTLIYQVKLINTAIAGDTAKAVNSWLWSFGRGKPRLGGLSIVQTHERHAATTSEAQRKRAAEPKRICKTAPA